MLIECELLCYILYRAIDQARKLFASEVPNHQWLKWFCEAGGGAHLTKPGWSKPHTHSNPTNLALFRHKITFLDSIRGGGAHTHDC